MPITMEPRENGHILYVKITDPWTLAELEANYKPEQKYRDESSFVMHTLINVLELKKIPPASLSIARRTPTLNHPRRGQLIIVGAMAFVQALLETLTRITRSSQLKFFKTEEDAMAYVRQLVAEEAKKASPQKPSELPTAGPGAI